jgi:YfiH family protein
MSYRWGEREAVAKNRERFLATHDRNEADCVEMEVEHGDRISVVNHAHTLSAHGDTITAEACITNDPAVTLFLLTADCLPVTLYDPTNQVIALAHLGWKPTGLALLPKVVQHMSKTFGTNPAEMHTWIGPSISRDSYVQEEVLQKDEPAWQPYVTPAAAGGWHIDLQQFNTDQLCAAGVPAAHITPAPTDTATDPNYFSHYRTVRSVRTGEPEGRLATIVNLP